MIGRLRWFASLSPGWVSLAVVGRLTTWRVTSRQGARDEFEPIFGEEICREFSEGHEMWLRPQEGRQGEVSTKSQARGMATSLRKLADRVEAWADGLPASTIERGDEG